MSALRIQSWSPALKEFDPMRETDITVDKRAHDLSGQSVRGFLRPEVGISPLKSRRGVSLAES